MSVNLSALEGRPQRDPRDLARQLVQGMTDEQRLALAGAFVRKESEHHSSLIAEAPQTPDELWDYIHDTWGIKIARVSVCPDHDAPFDFVCAGYFEWFPNIFEIGCRGSGKSFKTAMIIELNSRHKPGCESVVFGAVDEQSRKVYEDFRTFFLNGGLAAGESEVLGDSKMTETLFKCGSSVKCFPATIAKVNGPHPPKSHSEEVELMKPQPWKESRNLATDKIMPDGRRIRAQNYGTSTRKWKNGRVDKIYQAFLKAKAVATSIFGSDKRRVDDMIAKTSPFYVFIHCCWEISEQVPNCRCAPENVDLPEYDGDEEDTSRKCGCHLVQNGTWDREAQQPRTFDTVCRGKLYDSRGHRSLRENLQLFIQNDRGTWEAQQECREAESEGLFIKSFSRQRHGLSYFPIDPANGPVYKGVDWGTTHFACVLFVQYLARPVEAIDYLGEKRVLPAGSRVVFSELYEADLTSYELGERAIVREVKLASHTSFSRLPIRKRWADVQGAGDRKTWRKLGLHTSSYGSRVFSEHVKEVRGLYDADRAFVVVSECPHYCDEIEAWREDEGGKEVDENFNHAMAAGRYVFWGMHGVYNDSGAQSPEQSDVVEQARRQEASVPALVVSEQSYQGDLDEESWRFGLNAGASRG